MPTPAYTACPSPKGRHCLLQTDFTHIRHRFWVGYNITTFSPKEPWNTTLRRIYSPGPHQMIFINERKGFRFVDLATGSIRQAMTSTWITFTPKVQSDYSGNPAYLAIQRTCSITQSVLGYLTSLQWMSWYPTATIYYPSSPVLRPAPALTHINLRRAKPPPWKIESGFVQNVWVQSRGGCALSQEKPCF